VQITNGQRQKRAAAFSPLLGAAIVSLPQQDAGIT
jgi:hypothetical protein